MARVDVLDVAQVGGVRDPVRRGREELRRQQALEAGGERLERGAHASFSPVPGRGVCSKSAVTRSRIARQGQVIHAA